MEKMTKYSNAAMVYLEDKGINASEYKVEANNK